MQNIDENEMIYNEALNAILLNTIPSNDYEKSVVLVHYTLYYLLYF